MRHASAELRLWDNVVLQQQSVSLPNWVLNACICVSRFRLVHCAILVNAVTPPTTTFPPSVLKQQIFVASDSWAWRDPSRCT